MRQIRTWSGCMRMRISPSPWLRDDVSEGPTDRLSRRQRKPDKNSLTRLCWLTPGLMAGLW